MVFNRESGRRASRFEAQLRVDRSQVGIHGPGTDAKTFRDLAVHQAGGDEVEDLHLSRGEAVDSTGPRQSEPLAAV